MEFAQQQHETGNRRIKINLFCPSASKLIHIVAPEEQKLDLGSIARAFALDPTTLKLNGHFISRGVDHIASSVTWKSLIGFFSARGLSTGASHSDALLVDGKLSKIGSKRPHAGNGILDGCSGDYKRLQIASVRPCSTKNQLWGGLKLLDLKRKCSLEDESRAKKRRKWEQVISGWKGCSFVNKSMKRMRSEDQDSACSPPIKKSNMTQQS